MGELLHHIRVFTQPNIIAKVSDDVINQNLLVDAQI